MERTPHFLALKILGRNPVVLLILLLLAAAALRLPSLTLNSFWMDELMTATLTMTPFKKMLAVLWNDVHPPLFNVLVYLWSVVIGTSEFALRMLPAFFGIITVPISFLVFKKTFGINTALATSILVIFLPIHIYYSQELRSYSLAFLLSTVSLGMLFWYLEEPTIKHRWFLAITCAALFATHYISLFSIITILSIGSIGIHGNWRRKLTKASRLILVTLFLIYPILPHFIYKRFTMGSFWPTPVTFIKVKHTILYLFSNGGGTFSGNIGEALPLTILYVFLIIIAIIFALYGKNKNLSLRVLNLSLLSTIPLLGVITISLISPNMTVLIDRIILVFAPPIIVLAAVGLTSIPSKVYTFIILLLYSVISSCLLYSSSYYTVPTKNNYRAVAHEVAQLGRDGSNILFISLNSYHVTVERGAYYWQLFGVHNSESFIVPENIPADELLSYIRMMARRSNSNKIVLFSQHTSFAFRKDIVELCDQYFRKEDERVFPMDAFLVSYSLSP